MDRCILALARKPGATEQGRTKSPSSLTSTTRKTKSPSSVLAQAARAGIVWSESPLLIDRERRRGKEGTRIPTKDT